MSGRAEMDKKNDKWINERKGKCSQFVSDYIDSIDGVKTSATRKQYLYYLMDFEKYIKKLNVDICKVKPFHVEKYRNCLTKNGNKASIVNGKLSAIISFYNFLIKNGFVDKNPCDNDMKLKIAEKESVVYMTDEEIHKLKENIVSCKNRHSDRFVLRDLCIVQLGCATGLRVSAIVNIDIDDIDFEQMTIKVVEKGNKVRTIYIGENTVNSIKNWLKERVITVRNKEERALFIGNHGGRMSASAVRNLLKHDAGEFGKHITPHKMRSTCAMKLYDKTGDIYLTAQQLGHANVKNTMIYAKATEEKRRMAADLLD